MPGPKPWATMAPVGQPSFCAPRPLLVKYTHKSGKDTYSASLEQQEVANSGGLGSTGVADRRIPALTVGWSHKETWGHIALHALGQYFGVYKPAVAATTTTPYVAKSRYGKMEYTFLVSGDIRLSKADDIIFSFYEGDAQGSYGAGYQSVVFNDATRTVTAFRTIGWVAGYQHIWSPKYRSNVNVSGLHYREPNLTRDLQVLLLPEVRPFRPTPTPSSPSPGMWTWAWSMAMSGPRRRSTTPP